MSRQTNSIDGPLRSSRLRSTSDDNDETHAFISNHLATGAAALDRWSVLTNCEASRRASTSLIDRILSRQHSEGWYVEYQGFDAGYQSLATYYLADIATRSRVPGLGESLERSVEFVSHCVHPDGSFGGYYGSRNTRFYVPGGFHLLASDIARRPPRSRRGWHPVCGRRRWSPCRRSTLRTRHRCSMRIVWLQSHRSRR